MSWQLSRTIQCAKCPWKCATDPHEIPDGYDVEKHKALAGTIAVPGDYSRIGQPSRVMACHHSKPGAMEYCVGWLHHQLGPGNNIALRLRMMDCQNAHLITVVGEQHARFEDTLPTT